MRELNGLGLNGPGMYFILSQIPPVVVLYY